MRPSEAYMSGNRTAVRWSATGTSQSGKTAHFEGINVFTVNDEGLISRLEGYWDIKGMVAQIS
jgi:hypothetical protein